MSKLTIEVTPDELKEIVAKHVGSLDYVNDHVNPSDVELVIGTEWRGFGPNEHIANVFEGAKVTITR